jgi:hypothetical protein
MFGFLCTKVCEIGEGLINFRTMRTLQSLDWIYKWSLENKKKN